MSSVAGQPEYVGVPIQALRMGMAGTFDYGNGRIEKHSSFHLFSGDGVNEPTRDKAEWVEPQIGPDDECYDGYPALSIEEWHKRRNLWID